MPDKIEQQNSNVTDAQSEKIRYGAPDGPRKNRRENYHGREPLEYLGHEAVASFLAFPKELREFKSVAALAKHFNVARKTIYCWMKDIDVLKRADWLSETNKIIGKLVVRRACPGMSEKLVEMGMGGNISAIKLWAEITLREDKQQEKSPLSPSSLEEVLERAEIIYEKHAEMMTPTWLKERTKRLEGEKPPVEAAGPPPAILDMQPIKAESEPQPAPQPESARVSSCDACGTTRCAHGRCPTCDICEVCE
jgi:hypothetical protein